MLKGIDPLLNADVLQALCAMGHGDDLILCDTNFPAEAVARDSVLGYLLRIDAAAPEVARAVLSVYPLDSFVDDAAARMQVGDTPDDIAPVHAEAQAVIDAAEGRSWPLNPIERFDFYDRARRAFAIIQTQETRFYGNFALRKGVIPPTG
ncbi:ribose ABC transporter [Rhodobacteraceae bacterium 2CG4]|uniref:Ribose ABC transporter n=1 Tax=Halovulum marinum TaxID=2662447 RepID=A0A6L5Z0Q6_9RHOB|nr:RbsD/FucU domain-containing protein [Halovulum marinum]MSU90068.1 ribose ABC transporter [Halovulum marinum]